MMGKLSATDQIVSGVVPAIMGMAPIAGYLIGEVMKGGMGKNKVQDVRGLVEAWDGAFFRPRGLTVWVEQRSSVSEAVARRSESESSDSESESDGSSGDGRRRAMYERDNRGYTERDEAGYTRQGGGLGPTGMSFGGSGLSGDLVGMVLGGRGSRKGGLIKSLIAEVMKSGSMTPNGSRGERSNERGTRGEPMMETERGPGIGYSRTRKEETRERRRGKRAETNVCNNISLHHAIFLLIVTLPHCRNRKTRDRCIS